MRPIAIATVLAVVGAWGGPAFAAGPDPDVAACEAAARLEYPQPHRAPGEAPIAAGTTCGPLAHYLGVEVAPDPVAARRCAFATAPSDDSWAVHERALVLATVYANGEGVDRDFGLARKAACEAAPRAAERKVADEVVALLAAVRAVEAQGGRGRIDPCRVVATSLEEVLCVKRAVIDERRASADRVARLSRDWTSAQHAAWRDVAAAAKRYVDLHERRETETVGSQWGRFHVAEAARARAERPVVALLARAEAGELKASDARARARLDRRLRALLALNRSIPEPSSDAFVSGHGVAETQAAWDAYRSAWDRFASLRYAAGLADAVRAEVVRARIAVLEEVMDSRRQGCAVEDGCRARTASSR